MSREVLQMALAESIIHLKAINAVLEALAQPEPVIPAIDLPACEECGGDGIVLASQNQWACQTCSKTTIAQPEQEPVAFPSRRAVERAIESVENPKGMHLNDGKERVILPGGTLRYMLALIDHASPPQRQPLTDEQITKAFNEAMAKRPKDASNAETNRLFARAIEAAHNIGGV